MDASQRRLRKLKKRKREERRAERREAPTEDNTLERRLSREAEAIGWKEGDLVVRVLVSEHLACRPSAFLRSAGLEGLLFPGFWRALHALARCAGQERATKDDETFKRDAEAEIAEVFRQLTPGIGGNLTVNEDRLLWEVEQVRAEGKKPMGAYRAIAKTDRALGSKKSTAGSVKKAVARARKRRTGSGDIST